VAFAQGVSVRRLEETVAEALALRETDPGAWERCREQPECIGEPAQPGERQVCAPTRSAAVDEPRSVARCRVAIAAPVEVARLFDATLSSVRLAIERETGRLPSQGQAFAAMLEHAARSWELDDPWLRRRKPAAVRIFERDGWRCTVPGCSAQRNLHAHHIEFRSHGGSDEDSNQTTLCAFHHLRGVHGGALRIRGRAPEALVFELGPNPPERFRSGDVRMA